MATHAPSATIDQLIISSPYEAPAEHWKYDRETRRFTREPGRRPAGYVRASDASKSFDDPGEFVELPLVNKIRPRGDAWRATDYPSASGITRRLIKHWRDTEQREGKRFFFCQLEAIETLMWLAEAAESDRVGIKVPGDGGEFTRLCSKMATGSGKTILMSMLIAWQVLNKVTYPQDKRFSKNILVIAPGLTVKNRLEVLVPGSAGNYYQEFQIVPPGLEDKLRQGQTCRVQVRNWHKMDWESEEQLSKRRSVEETLFGWIVSDFGLNDTIESGLVKTPRVVVRDDGEQTSKYKSKFYHIYTDPEVKPDLNRKVQPHIPLPDLVGMGYYFLGKDWLETAKKWREEGNAKTPPVMITVANLINTAARVQYAFEHKRIRIEELCDPDKILHIDSKVLDEAEAQEELTEFVVEAKAAEDLDEEGGEETPEQNGDAPKKKFTKKERAERLRKTVDTIGREGQPLCVCRWEKHC